MAPPGPTATDGSDDGYVTVGELAAVREQMASMARLLEGMMGRLEASSTVGTPAKREHSETGSDSAGGYGGVLKGLAAEVPHFTGDEGTGRAVALWEYIRKLEAYFGVASLSGSLEVVFASSKLKGSAYLHWAARNERGYDEGLESSGDGPIFTWMDMKGWLLDLFITDEDMRSFIARLKRIQQTGTVAAHTNAFNRLSMMIVPRLPSLVEVVFYLDGLALGIRRSIESNRDNLVDLETCQRAALRLGSFGGRPESAKAAHSESTLAGNKSRACHACGVDGHIARNCPADKGRPSKATPAASEPGTTFAGFAEILTMQTPGDAPVAF